MEMIKNPHPYYTEEEAINLGFPVWKFRQLVEAGKIKIESTQAAFGKPDVTLYDGEDVEREYQIFAEEMKNKRK